MSAKDTGNKIFDTAKCEGCPGTQYRLYIVFSQDCRKVYLTAGSRDWRENWVHHERDRCFRVFSEADSSCQRYFNPEQIEGAASNADYDPDGGRFFE